MKKNNGNGLTTFTSKKEHKAPEVPQNSPEKTQEKDETKDILKYDKDDFEIFKVFGGIILIAFIITAIILKVVLDRNQTQIVEQKQEEVSLVDNAEEMFKKYGIYFLDNNIDKISKDTANRLIIDYEKYLKAKKDEYEKMFQKKGLFVKLYDYFSGDDNSMQEALNRAKNNDDYYLIKEIQDAGLCIVTGTDSKAYPIINYKQIMNKYGDYMYASVKKYMQIKVMAVDNPVIIGNKLQLSISELGQRLVKIEDILYDEETANPDAISAKTELKDQVDKEMLADLFSLYKMYYYIYVKGRSWGLSDDTPNVIIDSNTGKIKTIALTSYNSIIEKSSKTELAKGLVKYVEWLESHDYSVTEEELNAYFNTDKTVDNIRAKTIF